MHFKQLEQLTKDSFNLSTIVYAEETEQAVLDNLLHPGVHSVDSIKLKHYYKIRAQTPKGSLRSYFAPQPRIKPILMQPAGVSNLPPAGC